MITGAVTLKARKRSYTVRTEGIASLRRRRTEPSLLPWGWHDGVLPTGEAWVSLYFISTTEHIEVTDNEGIDLPNLDALRDLLRRTLSTILADEGEKTGVDEFTARACDEDGRLVMRAKTSFFTVDQ